MKLLTKEISRLLFSDVTKLLCSRRNEISTQTSIVDLSRLSTQHMISTKNEYPILFFLIPAANDYGHPCQDGQPYSARFAYTVLQLQYIIVLSRTRLLSFFLRERPAPTPVTPCSTRAMIQALRVLRLIPVGTHARSRLVLVLDLLQGRDAVSSTCSSGLRRASYLFICYHGNASSHTNSTG